ncbi:uncharacterized protein LOC100370855 [Saccoglossus kowalevskii]|uniref:Uncharacterized protein LOC100370855 n=1 Tax=Saccoglossus kowalevskii TaxID=10224 RepID=A0ABM0GST4_SACKO|nr:PREDICTED: uncharacterized protein LOC100370855 [Saccoglossus kowalevskii]
MEVKIILVCTAIAVFAAIVYGEEPKDILKDIDEKDMEDLFKEWELSRAEGKRQPMAMCVNDDRYCVGWKRDEDKRDPEQWKKRHLKLKGLNMQDAWKRSVRRRSAPAEE